MAKMGILWVVPVHTYSTHPPTAFLFLLPLSWLPWGTIAQMWVVLLIVALVVAGRAYGLRWSVIIALSPLALWAPLLTGPGQFPPVWLFGLALAWRWRDRPGIAGVMIALASLPKFTPMLLLIPFIQRRAWPALATFVGVWAVALTMLTLLDPHALLDYLIANRTMSPAMMIRADDGALLSYAARTFGSVGLALVVMAIGMVVVIALRSSPHDATAWTLWEWLAIALLPICWVYSLAPLLPGLLRTLYSGTSSARLLAVLALIAPSIGGVPWSSAPALVLTIVLAGLSLICGGQRHAARQREEGTDTLSTSMIQGAVT